MTKLAICGDVGSGVRGLRGVMEERRLKYESERLRKGDVERRPVEVEGCGRRRPEAKSSRVVDEWQSMMTHLRPNVLLATCIRQLFELVKRSCDYHIISRAARSLPVGVPG